VQWVNFIQLDQESPLLHKCANPACDIPFRSLREGKLFLAENNFFASSSTANIRSRPRREHFWLCQECASHLTLRFDTSRGVMMTVPMSEKVEPRFLVRAAFDSY